MSISILLLLSSLYVIYMHPYLEYILLVNNPSLAVFEVPPHVLSEHARYLIFQWVELCEAQLWLEDGEGVLLTLLVPVVFEVLPRAKNVDKLI